jgi:hypothetical protein
MSQRTEVRFDARLYTIDKWTFLRLPEKASGKLPSRGQVAVQGTINGHRFPDGVGTRRLSWPLDEDCWRATTNRRSSAGDAATLDIETLKDWPEPNVPPDLKRALAAAPQKIQGLWKAITPMALGMGPLGQSMQPQTLIRANDGSR